MADEVTELSTDEARALTETAKRSYATTIKEGESAYRQTVSTVQAGIDAAKQAALRAAADAWIKKYSGFLASFRTNLNALAQDDAAVAAVDRLTKAAAEKRLDDQARADLLLVGERLGLLDWKPNSIVPASSGGAGKSSWVWPSPAAGPMSPAARARSDSSPTATKEADQRYGAGLAISPRWRPGPGLWRLGRRHVLLAARRRQRCRRWLSRLRVEAAYAAVGGTLGVQWSVSEGMRGAAAGIPRLLPRLGRRRQGQSRCPAGRLHLRPREVRQVARRRWTVMGGCCRSLLGLGLLPCCSPAVRRLPDERCSPVPLARRPAHKPAAVRPNSAPLALGHAGGAR